MSAIHRELQDQFSTLSKRTVIMRKFIFALLGAVVMLSISTHETVQAQERTPSLKVGGGLGIPAGDFGDGANMGFAILGGVSVPILDNVHAMAEGHYSKYGADEDILGVDADAKMIGGNIGVMVRSSSTPLIVYGHGGLGLTRATASASVLGETISVSSSENAFSFVIGGGIQYPINPSISVAVDARYNHALTEESATQWMPITVSIVFTP